MIDRNAVRALVGSVLRRKGDTKPLTDTDSLVLSGRLDSLDVLQIVVFLENSYSIDFADQEFDQEAFDSIDRILTLIEQRSPAAGAWRA
jgi:acyl carrier protein